MFLTKLNKLVTFHLFPLQFSKMASSAALDGLPKQFVAAMKTLFEVMDDKKTGFVKLTGMSHALVSC